MYKLTSEVSINQVGGLDVTYPVRNPGQSLKAGELVESLLARGAARITVEPDLIRAEWYDEAGELAGAEDWERV